MKVPADLDALMWQIAEADDHAAIEEFKSRFPDYGKELDKRVFTVSGLKGSKPMSSPRRRERFMPSRTVSQSRDQSVPGWAMVVIGVAVLGGVSFATYGAVRFFDSQKAVPLNDPVVINRPSTPTTTAGGPGLDPTKQEVPVSPNQSNSTSSPQNQDPAAPDPFDRRVTIVSSQVELKTALADIAAQAGVILEMPPNFPNPMIQIDYRDVEAKTVLHDMGMSFGFSTFEQTPGTALLIPAVGSKLMDQGQGGARPGFSGPIDKNSGNSSEVPGAILELPGR